MVAPVREAIAAILLEPVDWWLAVKLHETLDKITGGIKPSAIIYILRDMTEAVCRLRLSGKKDLADKLDYAAWVLREVLNDLYFSRGNTKQGVG